MQAPSVKRNFFHVDLLCLVYEKTLFRNEFNFFGGGITKGFL